MDEFGKLSLREKIDTREKLIRDMRALNDGCRAEGGEVRSFTAEEGEKYRKMGGDVRTLTALIAKEKRDLELEGFTDTLPLGQPGGAQGGEKRELEEFRSFLRTGRVSRDSENRTALVVDGEGASAGVLAPQELVKRILTPAHSELSLLSKVNTVILSKAGSIGVPYEASDADDAAWTTEVPESVSDDSSLSYAKRELGAHALVKLITVSDKALKTNAFNVEDIIVDKVGYKMRSALEQAIVTGTGSGQPLGLFTASASGIPAADDFTASGSGALTADDIIKAKRKLKSAYRPKASWLFHPDTVTGLLLLKDKNDQYLWRSGLTVDDPDRLYGSPVIESDFVPHTAASGAYVGMFADFSRYWMTRVGSIAIRRLEEKYYPSVGFTALTYADGQPVMSEAFVRIKLA